MSNQYEDGIRDGMKIAWIEAAAAEQIIYVNDTQVMLIQLALDHATEDPEFRKIMLSRYNEILEVSD